MSDFSMRRLQKDIANVQREAHTFFRIEQDESDSRTINLFLRGPKKSPYEGFEFELRLYFTKDYPYDPPLVHFKTPIYHVNLDKYGNICLDIIDKAKDRWAASMDIQQIASSLSVLLMKPNIKDPLDYEAADLFERDRAAYNRKAHEMAEKYAKRI